MKKRITTISVITCLLIVGVVFSWLFFANEQNYNKKDLELYTETTKASTTPITTKPTQASETFINDLTGLPIDKDYVNNRPVAVMINNVQQAQPLLGVSAADVMYECLVEGSITRIMAVFKNPYDVDVIGSIRSARPYFINLAKGMDAIYIHVGGSTQAFQMLNSGMIDSINLDVYTEYMWRDNNRRYSLGYEHSAVTSGKLLKDAIDNKNFRTIYSNFTPNQKFGNVTQVQSGKECSEMKVTFSWYKNTVFTYDKIKNTYLISQFEKEQIDGNSNEQNSKPNILALYVNTYPIDNGPLQQLDLAGTGEGYYMNSGKVIPINWKRFRDDSQFEFTDKNGKALIMNPGKIYICCVPFEGNIEFN